MGAAISNTMKMNFSPGAAMIAAYLLAGPLPIAGAQEPAPPPASPTIREEAPGIYQIGLAHLDQKAMTLTFPGVLNMNQGLLEYLIVTPMGSTHESLLVTDAPPTDIQFAMLLLGAKGSGINTPAADQAPPPQIDAKYLKTAPRMVGDDVLIRVKWKAGGEEKTVPVEDWLINLQTKKTVSRGPWIYNGSMFSNGHFLAQTEGSISALVTNPAALINNPRKGNDDDQIWEVNEKAVPPVNSPVQIVIQLTPAVAAPPSSPAKKP
jgi:hypothetical protein